MAIPGTEGVAYTADGLELIEIAPGVDLERDILAQMTFRPAISPQLKTMDARIFRDEPMDIRDDILSASSGDGAR